jgi:hypothetical protein
MPSPTKITTFYSDVWVTGLVSSDHQSILIGRGSEDSIRGWFNDYVWPLTREPTLPFRIVQLSPVDEAAALLLTTISPDVLAILTGDIYLQETSVQLVVKDATTLHLPYTPETTLDATHIHLGYQFNYPAGWELRVDDYDNVFLSNVRDIKFDTSDTDLYPTYALIYRDPTRYCLIIQTEQPKGISTEAYVMQVAQDEVKDGEEPTTFLIGEYKVTRFVQEGISFDVLTFMVSLAEQVFRFSTNCEPKTNSQFVERVIATLLVEEQ